MNLLLLTPNDMISADSAIITGSRFKHISQVLKAKMGSNIRCGIINGDIGTGIVSEINSHTVILKLTVTQPPPKPLPLSIILALPRPKMLRRILKNVAELGIKSITLINSAKVEKSYWQSPLLDDEKIKEYFIEGLSQSRDTVMPELTIKTRFRPFVEDQLEAFIGNRQAFVAHPYHTIPMPTPSKQSRVVLIGPEGGFTEFEIDLLKKHSVTPISMGERIYKVENAITLLSAQLSCI